MARTRPAQSGSDPRPVRSRRGILAAAAGMAGAMAAAAVADAAPAQAHTGDSLAAGETNFAEASTAVTYDGSAGFSGVVLLGNDSTFNPNSAQFPAAAGGWAGAGAAAGHGGVPNGMYGYTGKGAGYGTIGWNNDSVPGAGAGVLGAFGGPPAPSNAVGTGITGVSDSTADLATAIYGELTNTSSGNSAAAIRGVNNGTAAGGVGYGMWGSHAGSGTGVAGSTPAGAGGTGVFGVGTTGVYGTSQDASPCGVRGTVDSPPGQSGAGVIAENLSGGTALQVLGEASFSRSGTVTVPAGKASAAKSGISLTAASLILATIQGNVPGVYVQGVTVITGSAGSFTVHLNRAAPAKTTVAWFVLA